MHVRLAILAAEDADFYNHNGFSVKGMSRAILKYFNKGEITGGSTITQQLVKNAFLTPEKTVTRKLKEIIIALGVEREYSKDKILEMYLNEVNFGGTAFGIQEAARYYFDKDVNQLTLSEAALLAGLIQSPTKYSPFGLNPELATQREDTVLDLMVENNFVSQKQANLAKTEKLTFAQKRIDMKAPHFVMYVKQILAEKYGEDYLEKGGLEVYTTLDSSIQALAEKAVNDELQKVKRLNVTNGAALVLNPQTGEILAMVGSKDYFDTQADGNVNVLLRLRQPGSSIKVINYANAFSLGLTPATLIKDEPVSFTIAGAKPYVPKNYDGKFRGEITIRNALAESRNIPAVKVLNQYGIDNMINLAQKMGITTWTDRSRYGLSLTLGGGDVRMLDLARVYATVANYGKRPDLISILQVKDHNGNILFKQKCNNLVDNTCNQPQMVDPRVAFMLTDILKDNNARSPAFGLHSALVIPKHPEVAVKTGTSNDMRDNVTFGYNQNYLTAVWVGNNNNSPMSRIASGITGAAPIWNTIMQGLLANQESVAWTPPEGIIYADTCGPKGNYKEWFLQENITKNSCFKDKLAKSNNEVTLSHDAHR